MKGYCRHFERGLGAAEAKEENIIVLVGRLWKAARRQWRGLDLAANNPQFLENIDVV